ncbi:MAG: photosynthetic complex assembly protein PuhC [Pseudomonadota bacterium]
MSTGTLPAARPLIVPRIAVFAGVAVLLLLGLLQSPFFGEPQPPAAPVLPALDDVVTLRIVAVDGDAIEVSLVEQQNVQLLQRFEPGESGFLSGLVRGLGRDRALRDATMLAPLRLGRNGSGGLELHDPLTGNRLVLRAFGTVNEAVLVRLHERALAAHSGTANEAG